MTGLSSCLLKKVIPEILPPLKHIFNQSLATGTLPTKFKIAKVIPVFKSGDALDPSNYRPISLLSTFSKILEKIVHNRLFTYLDTHSLLSELPPATSAQLALGAGDAALLLATLGALEGSLQASAALLLAFCFAARAPSCEREALFFWAASSSIFSHNS